jgi:hypothetical protein
MRTGDRPNFTPSSAAGFLATVMTSTKPSSGPIASSPSTTDQGIHVLIQSARGDTLGATGRRLAGLSASARSSFVREVRRRLETLSPDDFEDRSEVIGALAATP